MDFEDFARAELPGLIAFANVLCIDRGAAEDVVQEVLLRCQRKWALVSSTTNPPGYVRRMVVNEFLSTRRKKSRVVLVADVTFAGGSPDYAIGHADRDELARELGRLPRKQRAVLVMRYYLDWADADIAEALSCSQSTVRSQASRGLAALRIQLDPATTTTEVR